MVNKVVKISTLTAALLSATMSFPVLATANDAPPAPPGAEVALKALSDMGAHLRSLKSFEIRAEVSFDDVLDDGLLVQRNEEILAAVRGPDRLYVATEGAGRSREIFYDGSKVTVFGELLGYYAQFDAPGTIKETLAAAAGEYDLEVPIADLFFWGTGDNALHDVTAAAVIGPARIGDRVCDQYLYAKPGVSWQLWITQGAEKLPCKLAILDTSDETRPQYSATIEITPNKTFADEVFAFSPPRTAQKIEFHGSEAAN